jgi:hypothetical protein
VFLSFVLLFGFSISSLFLFVCVNFASRLIALLEEVLFLRGLGQGKMG